MKNDNEKYEVTLKEDESVEEIKSVPKSKEELEKELAFLEEQLEAKKLEEKIEKMKRQLAGELESDDIEFIEEVLDKKEKEEKKKSDTIQWIAVLLLVVFLFAGGYGYMWYQDKISKAKVPEKTQEEKDEEAWQAWMKEQENKYGYVLAHVNESNIKREWFNGNRKLPDLDNWKWSSKNYKRVSLSDEELRQLFGKNKFCQTVGQQLMLWYENAALGYPDGRGTWKSSIAVELGEYSYENIFEEDIFSLSGLWKHAKCKVAPKEVLKRVYIDSKDLTEYTDLNESLMGLTKEAYRTYRLNVGY